MQVPPMNITNSYRPNLKYCPKCKHVGQSNYCPDCGTEMATMETRTTMCPCCGGKGTIEEPVYNGVVFSSDPLGPKLNNGWKGCEGDDLE